MDDVFNAHHDERAVKARCTTQVDRNKALELAAEGKGMAAEEEIKKNPKQVPQ